MEKIVIKNIAGEEIFSHECEGNTYKKTVEAAIAHALDNPDYDAQRRYSYDTLAGVDFSNQDLRGVDFRFLNLENSNFENSDLRECGFYETNVRTCYFKNAILSKSNFENSDLTNANFSGATCAGVNFEDSDLTNANFSYANCDRAVFEGAEIKGMHVKSTSFRWAKRGPALSQYLLTLLKGY